MFSRRWWFGHFLFPPPRFIRAPCSFSNILLVSSLFSSYLPPLRPFLSIQPTPSSVYSPHLPSPIVRPSESYQPSGFGRPMSSYVFLPQRPICRFAPPPPTCAAGGTWLGCGWGGEGDGTPRDGLESLDSSGRRRPGKRAFVDARILSRVLRCPSLFSAPSPLPSVYSPHRPSPIVRPSESYQPSGFSRPMSSSVFLPSVPYAGLHPPPTCAAGGTWLGCGWGGKGDGAPPRWSWVPRLVW